jgi:hypothetical protein
MRKGREFCFYLAVEASASAGDAMDMQNSTFGQGPFAADIKGELDGLGDDPGKSADFEGDAENFFGIFAAGVFNCQIDDVLRQTEFVQGKPFSQTGPGPFEQRYYRGCPL